MSKLDFLPQKLFRFYSPTKENILDIRNRRIWLSSPTAFNDPFECSVGFNVDEYIKSFIIKFALFANGDMLFAYISELTRVQCAFVDEKEINRVIKFIAQQEINQK